MKVQLDCKFYDFIIVFKHLTINFRLEQRGEVINKNFIMK